LTSDHDREGRSTAAIRDRTKPLRIVHTISFVVRDPWAWTWIPAHLNPQVTDPDMDDSRDRGYGAFEGDWAKILTAVQNIITAVQQQPPTTTLHQFCKVEYAGKLSQDEIDVVDAWIGHTDRSPTVGYQERQIEDGRHRLWAARQASLATNSARPIPVLASGFDYVATALDNPAMFPSDTFRNFRSNDLAWWNTTAPAELRASNDWHIDQLTLISAAWPEVTWDAGYRSEDEIPA